MPSDNGILKKYKNIYEKMERIQGQKQDVAKMVAEQPALAEYEKDIRAIEPIDILSNVFQMPRDMVVPLICKSDMLQIFNSVKYLREKCCEMGTKMEKFPSKNSRITSTKNLLRETANDSQEMDKMLIDNMEPADALTGISNYYNTLSEMETNSKFFGDILQKFSPLSSDFDETTKTSRGIWDTVMNALTAVKNKIKVIKDRVTTVVEKIKGAVSEAGKSFLSKLDDIGNFITNSIQGGLTKVSDLKNMILDTLNSASRKFQDLILKLIEAMFDFLSKFGALAKNKGFPVSSVQLKAPVIKFEFISIFGFSIPIPKIDLPELTITMTPPNA